jgi:hypothetical protein
MIALAQNIMASAQKVDPDLTSFRIDVQTIPASHRAGERSWLIGFKPLTNDHKLVNIEGALAEAIGARALGQLLLCQAAVLTMEEYGVTVVVQRQLPHSIYLKMTIRSD